MKYFSPLAQFDVISICPLWFGGYEITLTNLSFTALAVVLINILFFYFFNLSYVIPRSYQGFFENLFMFVYRTVIQQTGKSGIVYFPFIFALFCFILGLNLVSMFPFGFAVTSHLIWTLYFSLSICFGIFILGLIRYQMRFLKLFVPEVPLLLYPMMILIELFSYIIRSFSLAIRLSANIMAGHTLVHILSESIYALCTMRKLIIIFPFLLLLAIFVLELGVACLQAYIFITLVSMYLHDSLHFIEH